jgi:hypothetical protein
MSEMKDGTQEFKDTSELGVQQDFNPWCSTVVV